MAIVSGGGFRWWWWFVVAMVGDGCDGKRWWWLFPLMVVMVSGGGGCFRWWRWFTVAMVYGGDGLWWRWFTLAMVMDCGDRRWMVVGGFRSCYFVAVKLLNIYNGERNPLNVFWQ